MATVDEVREKLASMTDEEFSAFEKSYGGDPATRDARVRDFAERPQSERMVCYWLGLKTEDEKLTTAALDSARSSRLSALAAVVAAIIALGAMLTTMVGR